MKAYFDKKDRLAEAEAREREAEPRNFAGLSHPSHSEKRSGQHAEQHIEQHAAA